MSQEIIRILGIDTSLRSTGVGIIEAKGNQLRAITYGRIKNPPKHPHTICLENIYTSLSDLIDAHHPDIAAIEGAFFAKNAKTAMILGQARGAAMVACSKKGISLCEHAPRRVKQAVTGNGGATKDQVNQMVMRLLNLKEKPQEDAADALALAICHFYNRSLPEELRVKTI